MIRWPRQECGARTLSPEASEFELLNWSPSEEREAAMQRILQANLDRFKSLLETETDPTKRAMIIRLLTEEENKLKAKTKPRQKEA